MQSDKKLNKKDWILIGVLSFVHLMITGIYRLFFYKVSTENAELFVYPIAKNEIISERAERIMHMTISGIIGTILILVIWYIIIWAFKEKRKGVFVIIICSIVLGIMSYPYCYGFETDTFEIYYMAVREVPEYWQSVYSTCIYNACMLVVPQPVTMPILQLSAFLGVLYYLSLRLKHMFSKWTMFLPWMILLIPGGIQIATNPYRNCINAIMCMAFFGVLFCDAVEKHQRTTKELLIMCMSSSFLTVFRSEQVLMMFVFLLALYYVYECPWKKTVFYFGVMIAACVVMMLPQKLGEMKYYGKDYSMINNMETLSSVLNEKTVNLSYDGAKEDIEAIEVIVPVDTIKKCGLIGYRGHVYAKNHVINQSFATEEQQSAYIKASNNILLHNPVLFLKARIRMLFEACALESNRTVIMTSDSNEMLDAYWGSVWLGYSEMYKDTVGKNVIYNNNKVAICNRIMGQCEKFGAWLGRKGMILSMRLIVFVLFLVVIFKSYKEKLVGKEIVFWAGTVLLLYAQLFGIFMLCPEGRTAYYYPLFYVMLIGNIILLLNYTKVKKSRAINEE